MKRFSTNQENEITEFIFGKFKENNPDIWTPDKNWIEELVNEMIETLYESSN